MSISTRDFIDMLLTIPAILIATTVHEAVRALVSTLLGDDTPKREGRLTLNPFNHFEPIGFLLMYSTGLSGVGVGWGKPVNTNARHYANRRTGTILTAVWPSVANFLVAIALSCVHKRIGSVNIVLDDFIILTRNYNIFLITCNFLPVAPFDCLKVIVEFVSKKSYFSISQTESVMQLIMILLLFSGFLAIVLNPICNLLFSMVASLTF